MKKSELIIPADMDILKRKAVIYGLLDEITNGLQTANQMKLLAPSDYSGYQAAYILLKRPLVISKRAWVYKWRNKNEVHTKSYANK